MSDFFAGIAWLIPLCPLVGAGLAALGPKPVRAVAHIPVVAGIALAFLLSAGIALRGGSRKNDPRDALAVDQQPRGAD